MTYDEMSKQWWSLLRKPNATKEDKIEARQIALAMAEYIKQRVLLR